MTPLLRAIPCALICLCLFGGLSLPTAAQTTDTTASSVSGASPSIGRPLNGWNYRGLTDHSDDAAVTYPYALIDRGPQYGRSLIQGALAQHGDDAPQSGEQRHPPATLIVNGNPMPLLTDRAGHFTRPFAFAPGSNSVEVRSDGRSRRIQFYEANTGAARAQMRVILAWDDTQAEIDLHVLTPDGQHAFWARPRLNGGGGLDVDSVDGPGPEIFTLTQPVHGPYLLYVNYWGNFGTSGYHFDEQTRQRPIITCTITVVMHENTPNEKRESVIVPLRKLGELTHVKTVLF